MSIPHHPTSLAHVPKEYGILTNRPLHDPFTVTVGMLEVRELGELAA
jgi:hypothetical protein